MTRRAAPPTAAGHDILVNATPIGMAPGDGLPAELGRLDPRLLVVDIIIKPEVTPLLRHARACGCRTVGGRVMLEGQAEEVARFFGIGGRAMAIETFLAVGERAEFSKTIGECDVALFAGLTGDFDPIHVDEEYARATAFGRRIAHGGLIMGLLSTTASMMSRRSVERGTKAVPVSIGYDRIRFIKPVFINDTVTARYTIEEIDTAEGRSRSKVEVVKANGELCVAGIHVMKWVPPR